MSNTKVIVDFTDYKAASLTPVDRYSQNQMTANAATFAAPLIPMIALGNLIDTYDLRLKHAGIPGSIIARCKPPRRSSTNEVQTCTGDPSEEASWTQNGIFQGGKAVLSGLTPGAIIWVRVRTVGLAGVMGAWSDPAQIRVL